MLVAYLNHKEVLEKLKENPSTVQHSFANGNVLVSVLRTQRQSRKIQENFTGSSSCLVLRCFSSILFGKGRFRE